MLEAVYSHLTSLGNLNILEAADFPSPKKAVLGRLFFTSRPVAASLARAYPKQNVEDYSRSWAVALDMIGLALHDDGPLVSYLRWSRQGR